MKRCACRELRGRNVVLYFYPKADTPGCTTQACGVRDRSRRLRAARTPSCSASRRTRPRSCASSPTSTGSSFTLLADEDHAVAEAYGVWVEKSMYGKKYWGNERTTFVIDPDGRIASVLRKVKPAEHDERVLAELAA